MKILLLLLYLMLGQPSDKGGKPKDAVDCKAIGCRMPATIEGVIAFDLSQVTEESALWPVLKRWKTNPFEVYYGNANNDMFRHLALATRHNEPTVFAMGGSKFARPHDVGTGRFDRILVSRFAKSIQSLREQLQRDEIPGIAKVSSDPGIFKASSVLQKGEYNPGVEDPVVDEYIGFPDDQTVAVARIKDDLSKLLLEWATPRAEQCGPFSSQKETSATLIVLRKYDGANARDVFSPHSPGMLSQHVAPIDELTLTIPSKDTLDFTIIIRTTNAVKAEKWLTDVLKKMGIASVPSFQHQEGGLTCNGNCPKEKARQFFMVLMALSGPNFSI